MFWHSIMYALSFTYHFGLFTLDIDQNYAPVRRADCQKRTEWTDFQPSAWYFGDRKSAESVVSISYKYT